MSKHLRIGTRDSKLALWQAQHVQKKLKYYGYSSELVKIKSAGDLIMDEPLHKLNTVGIFTKTLDLALLNDTIDMAVHSMKDVPTILPDGIVQGAVLERGDSSDVLVHTGSASLEKEAFIATGSLRRKAQWLHKYPHHKIENLRGNVNTRLKKLRHSNWSGAIFAKAGLERINLLPKNYMNLDWMIPAPAQGAIVIVTLEKEVGHKNILDKLNHNPTEICTAIERDFLRTLEGGCSAPIGGLALIKDDMITFTGALLSLDGSQKIEISKSISINERENFGKRCAKEILDNGGRKLMEAIKNEK